MFSVMIFCCVTRAICGLDRPCKIQDLIDLDGIETYKTETLNFNYDNDPQNIGIISLQVGRTQSGDGRHKSYKINNL